MKASWDFLDIIGELYCKKIDKYRQSTIQFQPFLTYRQYSKWIDYRLECINIWDRKYPKFKIKKDKEIKYIFQILGRIEDRGNN